MINETLDQFLLASRESPQVLIISADRSGGKTSTLRKVVGILKEKDILSDFTGFLAISESAEKRKYFAQSIDDGYKILLMEENHEYISKNRVCAYNFDRKSFNRVEESMLRDLEAGAKFVVIDEVARLEMADKGWANLIRFVQEQDLSLVITIRTKYLDKVSEKFGFSRKFVYFPQEHAQS